MPNLHKLAELIDEIDSNFKKVGGRIFITPTLITKMKKGSESPLLSVQQEDEAGLYQELCDELINLGLVRNRYRTEETYLITKTSNGEWVMTSGDDNHSAVKKNLNLLLLPELKKLSVQINKIDPQFRENGGRLFITSKRVYRIKNKVEVDFKLTKKSLDK